MPRGGPACLKRGAGGDELVALGPLARFIRRGIIRGSPGRLPGRMQGPETFIRVNALRVVSALAGMCTRVRLRRADTKVGLHHAYATLGELIAWTIGGISRSRRARVRDQSRRLVGEYTSLLRE